MAWSAPAFLRNLGGLLRKNLFCDERASCDRKLNVLDWLFWHDLAMGGENKENKKQKKNVVM